MLRGSPLHGYPRWVECSRECPCVDLVPAHMQSSVADGDLPKGEAPRQHERDQTNERADALGGGGASARVGGCSIQSYALVISRMMRRVGRRAGTSPTIVHTSGTPPGRPLAFRSSAVRSGGDASPDRLLNSGDEPASLAQTVSFHRRAPLGSATRRRLPSSHRSRRTSRLSCKNSSWGMGLQEVASIQG